MAAASYYDAGPRPPLQQQHQSSGLYPPQGPQRASSQPAFTYSQPQPIPHPGPPHSSQMQSQAQNSPFSPPPYQPLNEESKPTVHFAPTPSPLNQHRPSNGSQPRPDPYIFNQPNYQVSPNQHLAPQQQSYIPQNYQTQSQPQQYTPHYQPVPHHRLSDSSAHGGYVSDPERHRRKHRDRGRRISDRSRSTKADGLLGAAGGGLIGDLIFPGLGTLGGALVGWVGGTDYGKHRKWREEKRDRDQERWERKYRSASDRSSSRSRERERDRERDTDRDRGRRRSSHDRKGSHDRRRPHS